METAQGVITLVAGIVAIMAAVFSIVSVIVLLRYKTDELVKIEVEHKKEIRTIKDDFIHFKTIVTSHIAEQNVLYKVTAKALDSLEIKISEVEREVHRHHGD